MPTLATVRSGPRAWWIKTDLLGDLPLILVKSGRK